MNTSAQPSLLDTYNQAQTQLVTQTADLPLGTLAGMVNAGSIDLQPGFQRRERWGHEQQSALIESFLLNVPVPPIYLSEEQVGTYVAIDGKQRLRAIADFMSDALPLSGLERLNAATGMKFSALPVEIRNTLNLRPFIRVATLLKQTDQELKYEVFLRLNKGGETLNAQEIRNVAYRGPLNDAIYQLAENDFLKRQLKIDSDRSSAYRQMVDAEYVLRFLTLSAAGSRYSGKLSREMDRYISDHRNAIPAFVKSQGDRFLRALNMCKDIWGDKAFQRPGGKIWRDQTIAGMYDAQMIAVDRLDDKQRTSAVQNKDRIADATRLLFADKLFEDAVRTGTNTPNRIKLRVDRMHTAIIANI